MRRAVPILAAVLLLTACTQTTTGSPTTGSTGSATTTTSGKSGSGTNEPKKRPKTINIKDVDPCTLLSAAQRTQFGADVAPVPGTVPQFGWKTCRFNRTDRKYITGTTVIPDDGIEFYTESPKKDEAEKLPIGGFPAVRLKDSGALPSCTIAIDVSDGQMVAVDVTTFEKTDVATLCQVAPQVAEAVVANLMAK